MPAFRPGIGKRKDPRESNARFWGYRGYCTEPLRGAGNDFPQLKESTDEHVFHNRTNFGIRFSRPDEGDGHDGPRVKQATVICFRTE